VQLVRATHKIGAAQGEEDEGDAAQHEADPDQVPNARPSPILVKYVVGRLAVGNFVPVHGRQTSVVQLANDRPSSQ